MNHKTCTILFNEYAKRPQRGLRTKLSFKIVCWLRSAASQLESAARNKPEMSEIKSDPTVT